MKKVLLFAALFTGAISHAQECTAVSTLNENFNTFNTEESGFPQNCWSSISDGPMVYIDGNDEEENNYVTFYASNFADTDAFLITPELTSSSENYELSFDTQRIVMGPPPAPGTVTIQLGILTDNTDAETFVAFGEPITVTDEYVTHSNITITADEGSYIAFKITGDIVHNAALIDNVVWSEIPPTVCDAVDTLDENFNEFAAEDFPQNCWLSLANGPMVYVDQDEEGTDKYATYYSFFTVNEPGYIITPEITASTSARTLTFDSYKIGAGVVTVKVGTISDAEDEETFTEIGDLIELTEAQDEYTVEIPALADNSRLAFQIIADTNHHAALLDNITLANSLSNIDFNNVDFTIYPNPSSDKNITVELNADSENTNLIIYNITGAKVFESVLTSNTQQLNLTSLNSGMYIVKVQAGNYTETKKLIIR